MAHYHLIRNEKSSLGIPSNDEHFHNASDGAQTSTGADSPGHTHSLPDGSLTGLPVEVGSEAFSDIQKEVSGLFGHQPEDIYPMAFTDDATAKALAIGMRRKLAMDFFRGKAAEQIAVKHQKTLFETHPDVLIQENIRFNDLPLELQREADLLATQLFNQAMAKKKVTTESRNKVASSVLSSVLKDPALTL